MRLNAVGTMRIAALAALLGAASATASAQTFKLGNAAAAPGGTAVVDLILTGGPTDTAALNFTIRISDAQKGLVGDLDGAADASLTGYTYLDNNVTVTSGREYRGVLYAPTTSTPAFSTSSDKVVAKISVPVAAGAPAGTVIALELISAFDTDGITGLNGVSNAAGVSIVPGGALPKDARPAVDNTGGKITVSSTGPAASVDFTPVNREDGWDFALVIPGAPNNDKYEYTSPAGGETIKLLDTGAFGFFQRTSPLGEPTLVAGKLMINRWTWSSSATAATGNFNTRLRVSPEDGTYSTLSTFVPNSGVVLPTSGAERAHSVAHVIGAEQLAGQAPGLRPAFDLYGFGFGSADTVNVVKKADIYFFDLPLPGTPTTALSLDFTGGTNGFVSKPGLGDITPTTNFSTTGGLRTEPAGGITPEGLFAFGFWEKTADTFSVASGKIYRIETTIASDDPNTMAPCRIRFSVGQPIVYVSEFVVTSASPDASERPSTAGKTVVGFAMFPDELNGQPVEIYLDTYSDGKTGGATWKKLIVQAYDRPTL